MNGVGYQVPSIGRHAPGAARVLRAPSLVERIASSVFIPKFWTSMRGAST